VTPVLELTGVGKTYPAPTQVTALADVDLAVDHGETLAILGPSGSGKSTLLTLVGTLERPTTGTLIISGADTSRLSDASLAGLRAWRIGFVFQQFHLLEHLTVIENVATGLLYRGWSTRQRQFAAAAALERVGLSARRGHRPRELSGGERQRVAIARAVAGEPDLLLADEPTGNLDSETGHEIVALLGELADRDTTVLVVTHDPSVAAVMRREIRLRDGRLLSDSGTRACVRT
jgi:putative ABC transport system ATP-binding protein